MGGRDALDQLEEGLRPCLILLDVSPYWQDVIKGQKIAEMGSSDADQVKLHFEIRRFGKPVDPIKLLPSEPPA